MQLPQEIKALKAPLEVPIICPVCWTHDVERIEGMVLSARSVGGGDLSQVSMYRCIHWHLFALFYQPAEWEA